MSFIMHLNILTVFIASLLSGWLSKSVDAQALGSFYYGKGPGVVAHDPSTGNFLYSVYTNNGFSDIQPLTVKTKPKNGTAIACSGYYVAQSVYVSCCTKNGFFAPISFLFCFGFTG